MVLKIARKLAIVVIHLFVHRDLTSQQANYPDLTDFKLSPVATLYITLDSNRKQVILVKGETVYYVQRGIEEAQKSNPSTERLGTLQNVESLMLELIIESDQQQKEDIGQTS